MKNIIYSVILIFALFLIGCADAGKNQTVNSGDLVTLDASASTPSHGGKIKKYKWKQVRGKRVKLSNKSSVQPTFTAPTLNKKSRLLFRVTAFEYGGNPRRFRSYDYVKVTVLPKIEKPDTTAPVITLNGEETITLTKGNAYEELGATAIDNKDGDITTSIVIDGLVDTSTEGLYTVTYNVSDTASNEAEAVTRTVNVILPADTTPPVITLTGGEVTLTVGETYIELGATATDDRDTVVDVNISSNVDTSTPGSYTVTYTANDDAGNEAEAVTRTVNVEDDVATSGIDGTIRDIAGNALKGVKVYSVSHETLTNADGYYVLETNGTNPVSIVAELSNYIQNSQVVDLNVNTTQNFTLVYVDKIEVFDAEVGMEIKTKGAKINFPASSISNEDGTEYTGQVTTKVAYNRVTSDIGQATFPGDYIGETTEGNTTILRSYGFIDVTMEDNTSNTLKVADGSSVTLTFPMDDNIDVKPATIPLWYYDTEKGIWIEDGVATYDETTNSYSGDVTHFTTWNLDAKMNAGSLKGCVEDSDGNPVTSALLNIEGAGWRSGLKQNSGNTFEFQRAPTGMAVTLTAYTTEGTSQTETITLAPNENRVMTDCLVIDNNTTSPIVNVKGRLVNIDGELITGYARINITNTETGASIASVQTYTGIIDMSIVRPDNNKITVTVTTHDSTTVQPYILNPNSNTLNIGDIAFDFVQLTAYFINTDGNTVEIINYASITINSTSGTYITEKSSYSSNVTQLQSYNFLRPQNNTVNLKFTYDGYVTLFDENVTITGTSTNINIVIPGMNIHGTILDRDGNIFSVRRSSQISLYDPDNLDEAIGWGKFNSDGTFTSSYFTKPSSGQILLRISIDDADIDTIITLNDDTTVEVGNIETNLSKITGNLTNYSYGYTNGYTFIKILDTDNNNTDLGYANITSSGTIGSKYINMPESGNITLMLRKNNRNQVWVKRSYHFDANESLDVGTITLENASVTGTLSYLDGETMPAGISIRTFNTDYVDNNLYNIRSSATYTLANGQMNTTDFYKPSNGQIKLMVDFKGDDHNVTVDLDNINQVTTKDLNIDAIIITGTALYPHDNSPASGLSLSSSTIGYLDSLGSSDINGTFILGPILRPNDTNITLVGYSYKLQGTDQGTSVSITEDTHITDIDNIILHTTLIKGCVDVPVDGFGILDIRYNDPFSRNNIDNYPIYGSIDSTLGTFNMMSWQDDTNNSLYIFASDTNDSNHTTKELNFVANTPLLDYTSPCIVTDPIISTTNTIEVSSGVNNISIDYMSKRNYYSDESYNFEGGPAYLDVTKNGIYIIKSINTVQNFSDLITLKMNGVEQTLVLFSDTTSFNSSTWVLFEIEIYQGEVTIKVINQPAFNEES